MMKSIRMLLWMVLLTGVIYPLCITGIAQVMVPKKAQGDLIFVEGKIVGAKLIGQKFKNPSYFWSRPSFNDYSPMPAEGSNLGPTSSTLKQLVADRRRKLASYEQGISNEIPSELLFTSASGLDPHITLQGALFQVKRVAEARKLTPEQLKGLIKAHAIKPIFKFLGPEHLNVLLLNISLDEMEKQTHAQ
jgi:potassium-transporting ATPase KdpC subunit